jgi:hypothetical protein
MPKSPFTLRLLLVYLVFCLPMTLLGQYYTEYTYSFGRPHAGGDFALRQLMIEDSMEFLIRTYPPQEIVDFDPLLSPGSVGGNLLIVVYGVDSSNVWQFFTLDWSDGHILHQWAPQQVVPRLVTLGMWDTLLIIGPPPGGGNERLVKLDLASGTETLVGSFLPGQLASTLPARLVSESNFRGIYMSTVDTAGVSRILEIDPFTAQVNTVFTTSAYPIRCLEVTDRSSYSDAYVLVQPYGQSHHELRQIALPAGNDQLINSFPPSAFQGFHPQTFYVSNSDFGITTVDSLGDEQVKTFFLDSSAGSAYRYWIDPGAYDAKVLAPNGVFFVSIQDPAATPLGTYPNPTRSAVQLQDVTYGSSYQLWDALGRLACSGTWTGEPIPVASLPAGVYMLHVRDGEGVRLARVVKQ